METHAKKQNHIVMFDVYNNVQGSCILVEGQLVMTLA